MRTDDDSWDITESVGATALGVAAIRAYETSREDALFRDPYAAKLVGAVGSEGWNALMTGALSGQGVSDADLRGWSMGSVLVARTLYFDEYFADALRAGIRQIVILAAGLDARAYRLEWPSGTRIFELDQPKVLAFKARALAGDEPAADRREVAIDLRQDWPKALLDKGFELGEPTAWLAEGLLRYLPGHAQDQLLEKVVELSAPGSRMALNLSMDGDMADEFRERRRKVMAEAGIHIDLENLFYPWEDRKDPRDWFAMHRWLVTQGDPVTLLEDHGRTVPDAAKAGMGAHILMTATKPRGDDTL
ncbi:class I SAM-dependent methyltransferase [Nocardia aurantiaca]|uniref:S-adenosyl-L-methionine-dependent methyltransferase n=1 Tax=Nocardia aurantiaca TaxID=2675850 RepID=A0A6I3KV16_9NOCA|nr:class I SAM-dependent methyltransferase [Nocardia aurantiaca]MTE13812.1 SAM-dependent methyltransferase [Nocardia aurantiaca]